MSSDENALVAQALRHFAVDDALRQSLDDGGLADAGLADEHRIVLGAPLQNLNGAANLIVAADHRIELALGRALGQIDAVFFQRLAILLGARILHLGAAAHFLDGLFERGARRAVGLQHSAELAAIVAGREHEQFAGNELIAALLRQLVGDVQAACSDRCRAAPRRPIPRPWATDRAPPARSERSLAT